MGCDDFEVLLNNGGTLRITGGVVSGLNLKRVGNTTYDKSGGTVTECDSFYIIKTPTGTAVINL